MPMPNEVLLITADYIKKYTEVNGAVDPNVMKPAIYLAQDKYLTRYLGSNLLQRLKDDVVNQTLTGDYEVLLDSYVRKSLLWWTMVELLPSLLYKLDNGSIVQRESDDTNAVSREEMETIRDRARDNAVYYTQRLIDYLCHNSSLFVEYNNNTFPELAPSSSISTESGIVFSDGYQTTRLRWELQNILDRSQL